MTTSFAKRRASSSSWHHFFFFFFFVVDEVDEDVRDYDRNTKNTTSKKERKSQPFLCVCPHKNAKAAASVFATDDHCSNNDKSELRQKCVRVCVLMRSPNNLLSSFSSCMHFFSSSTKILLFFSLSHLQQRRIKNEPRKTGDVVARARRARRSVSLFILLLLLGLLRLCLLLSLCLSH